MNKNKIESTIPKNFLNPLFNDSQSNSLKRDVFTCIAKHLPKGTLANFRLVCKSSSSCEISDRFFLKVSWMELQNLNGIAKEKLQFILINNLNYHLSLIFKSDMRIFYQLLCAEQIHETIVIQLRKIASLYVSDLGYEGKEIFENILRKIHEYENIFMKLKYLKTYQFSNFTNRLPVSIEDFESAGANQHVRIESQTLKKVKIGRILTHSSFEINLPKLNSIKFNELNCDIRIPLNNHCELKSINVAGKEITFSSNDRSIMIPLTVRIINLMETPTLGGSGWFPRHFM